MNVSKDQEGAALKNKVKAAPEISKFANKNLPEFQRTNTGLTPYSGPWTRDEAQHLLKRCLFGAKKTEITQIANGTLIDALDLLFNPGTPATEPLVTDVTDTGAPLGTTWVKATFSQDHEGPRTKSLKAWWTGLLINQEISLREKLTVFWHNHFVTETKAVNDSRYFYKYIKTLRDNSLGNFKDLTKLVTLEPAMLVYLNGNQNLNVAANENYARELLELFTIGKGPSVGPGDYTYFTELDVQSAAKVLSGWRDNRVNINSDFVSKNHNRTEKHFSYAFDNASMLNKEDLEYVELINMIFQKQETAKCIVRKLYRYFVYYVIDENVESTVINELATDLYNNNYEIEPVLRKLLASEHFFDPANRACYIKNPMDHLIGSLREFNVLFPDSVKFQDQYALWWQISVYGYVLDMYLGDPPNVAGWAAYYQSPQFHEMWINSVSLPYRNQFSDAITYNGIKLPAGTIKIDVLPFIENVIDTPSDPVGLIDDLSNLLFSVRLSDKQKAFLKETLIPGLPDFEWTMEWDDYKNNPGNTTKANAVRTKLQALLKSMMSMAEYQLA